MTSADLKQLADLQSEAAKRDVTVKLWFQLDDGASVLWFAELDEARYALQFLGEERILK